MTLIEDRQEGQPERAHLLYKGQQLCWQRHRNRQLVPTVRLCMQALLNSCVDGLNTEGSRDSAYLQSSAFFYCT